MASALNNMQFTSGNKMDCDQIHSHSKLLNESCTNLLMETARLKTRVQRHSVYRTPAATSDRLIGTHDTIRIICYSVNQSDPRVKGLFPAGTSKTL